MSAMASQIKSLFSSLLRLTAEEGQSFVLLALCEGNPMLTGDHPWLKASKADNVSISSRFYGSCLSVAFLCLISLRLFDITQVQFPSIGQSPGKEIEPRSPTEHQDNNAFKCGHPDCKKTYSRRDNLLRHMRSHEENAGPGCDHCQKTFRDATELRHHVSAVHTGIKFQCLTCEKCFKFKSSLQNHVRLHNDKAAHKCDFCGKCYNSLDLFDAHVNGHHGERPYSCDKCGATFASRPYAKIHSSRCGNDEKTHECSVCGKKFKDSHYRKMHEEAHRGKKFTCHKCGKSFVHSQSLKRHEKVCK